MITTYINDIKMFTNEFDVLDIFSRQAFLVKLYQIQLHMDANDVSDEDRIAIRDALHEFLTKFRISRNLTIKDFNLVFGPPIDCINLNDEYVYEILYNMLAEEWRSPDMIVSFKVKELISGVIDRIMQETEQLNSTNCYNPTVYDIQLDIPNQPLINNQQDNQFSNNCCNAGDIFANNQSFMNECCDNDKEIFSRREVSPRAPEFYPVFNDFVIKNKDYLKEYIVRNNLIEYKCSCCGLTSWQNNPLMLYLHSKSGIYSNKNLSDLEFLCPNCYSQIGD